MDNKTKKIVDLFKETGKAHHHAYLATDGADPDWPIWYAGQMQPNLNTILGTDLTQSEVVYWLVKLDKAYRDAGTETAWPLWYAGILCATYA